MINRQLIAEEWSEKVTPAYNVPKELFEHQLDAMALLKEGKHVFLGMHPSHCIDVYLFQHVFQCCGCPPPFCQIWLCLGFKANLMRWQVPATD